MAQCEHRASRLATKAIALRDHVRKARIANRDKQPTNSSRPDWYEGGCEEMLIRLKEVANKMALGKEAIARVRDRLQLSNETELLQSLAAESNPAQNALSQSLHELVLVSKHCREANKIVLDLTYRYWQIYTLSGCYGRVVDVATLITQKTEQLDVMRTALSQTENLIMLQGRATSQLFGAGGQSEGDSPQNALKKGLFADDLGKEHDTLVDSIRKKTNSLGE